MQSEATPPPEERRDLPPVRTWPTIRHRANGLVRRPTVRAIVLFALDGAAWLSALGIGVVARFEFEYSRIDFEALLWVAAIAVAAQAVWGVAAGLYPGRWRLGSFREAGLMGIGAAMIGVGLSTWLFTVEGARPVPLSVSILAPGLFVLFALGPRFLVRMMRELRQVSHHARSKRALFFGAGEAGYETIRALSRDPKSVIQPVAFLDDDPAHHRLRVGPCRVVGGRDEITQAAARFGANTMVITMPSAPRADIATISKAAGAANLEVLILPRMAQFLNGEVKSDHIRPLQFGDFLGRDPVALDSHQMERFIKGRRVLITGAGGSIGSELCAAVSQFKPAQLILLDRDENALHAVQLRLDGRALLDSEQLVIADIRDPGRIKEVFEHHKPEVVFHAAALKHVTFLERFPGEAVKTNVLGTLNVLEAAHRCGVDKFVNISTDKAADPGNVLGYTKRIAERLASGFTSNGDMVAVSVRFGNVLGSNGSIIPTMRHQILNGGPITITHPEVTRFFMTTNEAADLVIQAGAIGRRGEVMVLDMGDPVSIIDLAHNLIAELDPDREIEIEITGLRPGEKLHEVLTGPDEDPIRRPRDGITVCAVPPLDPAGLADLESVSAEEVRLVLRSLARGDF